MSGKIIPYSMDCPRWTAYPEKESHKKLRAGLKEWILKEVEPHIDQWEEDGAIPRSLHQKAAQHHTGFYNLGIPAKYGGTVIPDQDIFHSLIVNEEMVRCGSLGFGPALMTWGIGLPPILNWGPEWMKQEVATGVASGEKIICLCITEPAGGSDVANIQTTAVDKGDHWIVNGNKTFITSGCKADYFTVVVRTSGKGLAGMSLMLLDSTMPGIKTTPMKKMGWLCSDTAVIAFENVKVPKKNLIGKLNRGFYYVMNNFNMERVNMANSSIAASRICMEEAIVYARQRKTFGKPLIANQGIRWKLIEVIKDIEASQAFLDQCAWMVNEAAKGNETDPLLIAKLSMLKLLTTRTLEKAAREACQVFGGKSFIRGSRASKVERLYREVRVMAIGGGSEEIMLELASRQSKL
eukprot:TRINITY_DN4805_c0_g1_i1.p1 TRINITY_DN4805_c0_g1~~TRINITY_DN4805_c0_g1_i1.p1  ORF type:complete len:408 (+),score=63.14 TRINITY_DN4805_c0_g1_i1:92-1315(+)